jgi:hypothetical protein
MNASFSAGRRSIPFLRYARDCESRRYDAFVAEKEPFPRTQTLLRDTIRGIIFVRSNRPLAERGSFSVVPGRTIGKSAFGSF